MLKWNNMKQDKQLEKFIAGLKKKLSIHIQYRRRQRGFV